MTQPLNIRGASAQINNLPHAHEEKKQRERARQHDGDREWQQAPQAMLLLRAAQMIASRRAQVG